MGVLLTCPVLAHVCQIRPCQVDEGIKGPVLGFRALFCIGKIDKFLFLRSWYLDNMINKASSPDIAIVGGGPCGLALAGILERAGFDYIVYERGSQDEVPRGGCLDLHTGSGQRACREAGCFDEMRKYGRLGDATEAWVWDHNGNRIDSWGKDRDAPELDRHQIKLALLTTIPPEKILWNKEVAKSTRDEKGRVTLHFAEGSTATGFKLVVGADGVRSKIRHLVMPPGLVEIETLSPVADDVIGNISNT